MKKALFAPWRMDYVKDASKGISTCVFCSIQHEKDETKSLILYQTKQCMIVMNRYPYAYGHIMIIPKKHTKNLMELSDTELFDLFDLMRKSQEVLKKTFKPHGFNVGINFERVAGAGIVDHLHVHIVPRWLGDVNFMPLMSEAKVISEHIQETFTKLSQAFKIYFN